jgi:RTX calcium-binding nonapeptide repeat (4 copies)
VVIVAAVLLVAALCAQSASARVLRAAPGGDRLTGGRAADVLVGAAGDDILRGEGGNDRLAPVGMPEIRWSMGAAGFEPALQRERLPPARLLLAGRDALNDRLQQPLGVDRRRWRPRGRAAVHPIGSAG